MAVHFICQYEASCLTTVGNINNKYKYNLSISISILRLTKQSKTSFPKLRRKGQSQQ